MEITEPCREVGEVRDLMTPDPVTVMAETPVCEVWKILAERRFRHMLVADEGGHMLGLVSQRDLLVAVRSAESKAGFEDTHPISDFMHREVDTVRPDCCVAEAARHMLRSKRSCLPVIDDDGTIVGIITEADYLRMATRDVPSCTCGGVAATGE
jgi:CBS domain-containing protein